MWDLACCFLTLSQSLTNHLVPKLLWQQCVELTLISSHSHFWAPAAHTKRGRKTRHSSRSKAHLMHIHWLGRIFYCSTHYCGLEIRTTLLGQLIVMGSQRVGRISLVLSVPNPVVHTVMVPVFNTLQILVKAILIIQSKSPRKFWCS